MKWPGEVDWAKILAPDTPLLEIFVRGSVMYVGIFVLLRLFRRREAGTISVSTLLVTVLIADAAQNAMATDYKSLPDGLLLVATIVFWSFALDWLAHRFRPFRRLVHPPPLPLVKDGRMIRQNMRRELLTEDELMSQLREQGIKKLDDVKEAFVEGDGSISIIKFKGEGAEKRTRHDARR
jgi:uncharacterized membrane protein YcaP (DUF421 family)